MASNAPQRDDRYARESFSLRRMSRWQLWGITIASAIVVVGLLFYATGL